MIRAKGMASGLPEHCELEQSVTYGIDREPAPGYGQIVTFRCHTCGYRSTNAAFFRREAGGILDQPVTICAGCRPYRPLDLDRLALRRWISNALILGVIAYGYGSDFGTPWQGLALFLAATFSAPLNVTVHELGHALVARALGYDVLTVEIGKGPRRAGLRLGRTRIDWRRYAFLGGETTYIAQGSPRRWGKALVALAGPVANLMLATLFAAVPLLLEGDGGFWAAACTGLVFANLGMAFLNLIIWRHPAADDGAEIHSDGAQVIGVFRRAPPVDPEDSLQFDADRLALLGRPADAARLYDQLMAGRRCDAFFMCKLMHLTDRAEGPQAALAAYERRMVIGPPRQRPWDPTGIEAFLHANLAWYALKTADPAKLPMAETFAALAFATLPNMPVVRATMGMLRVRLGALEDGEPLLLDGLRDGSDALDGADFCAILAQTRRAASDSETADDYEALGRHILAA
jgi:Zn-dependent protease